MIKYSDLDLSYDKVDIVHVDNTNVLVASRNDEYVTRLKRYFQNEVKHARFSNAYKSGSWDGKIRFLQNNGLLPRGLLQECIDKLEEWDIKYKLDETLIHQPLDTSNFRTIIEKELIDKQTGDEPMVPWDHQWETAEILLQSKRGITKSATSSGKSFTITLIAKYLLYCKHVRNIMLVVPRSDLVIQFQKDAEEYGFERDDIGLYFGRVKDEGKPLMISTWQSLQNVENREYFEEIECLIVDECFVGNTKISTEHGYKEIQEIKCGDKVWSVNEETNERELKEVKKVFENRSISKELIEIELENGKSINCTPNHLLFTKNRGWVKAGELTLEDDLELI
jgi:hypothetical protein